MKKPTFQNIAALAQVGTATVERVLNGRGGVRPETAARVITAARQLGYPRILPEAHRGLMRIEVLMVRPETAFFRRLSAAFERIAATLNPLVVVQRSFMQETNTAEIARRIGTGGNPRAALILVAPDHPRIRAAVEAVAMAGLPVISIVTRTSDRIGDFVGIDNYAAGRSAAMFMSRMMRYPGRVIALAHPIYKVHRDRIAGFSDYLATHPGKADFDWLGFGLDEGDRAADLLFQALRQGQPLAGLYNAGGANDALLQVLRRDRRGREIFFVGHELTDPSRQALRDGFMDIVLDQAPEAQARRALDLAMYRIGMTDIAPDDGLIRFLTITAENC